MGILSLIARVVGSWEAPDVDARNQISGFHQNGKNSSFRGYVVRVHLREAKVGSKDNSIHTCIPHIDKYTQSKAK